MIINPSLDTRVELLIAVDCASEKTMRLLTYT